MGKSEAVRVRLSEEERSTVEQLRQKLDLKSESEVLRLGIRYLSSANEVDVINTKMGPMPVQQFADLTWEVASIHPHWFKNAEPGSDYSLQNTVIRNNIWDSLLA